MGNHERQTNCTDLGIAVNKVVIAKQNSGHETEQAVRNLADLLSQNPDLIDGLVSHQAEETVK
ncbi:hypothetical protein HY439_01105 [Candidatus Microgenomates bacterium]|nr:hypothetical protein [Candidatus Microgenomates bacterium]